MLTLKNIDGGKTVCLDDSAEPIPIGMLRENGHYRIEFESAGSHDPVLRISDEELPPTLKERTPNTTRVRWDWNIKEYAGEATLCLLGGATIIERALDIAPHPFKLGADSYAELLDDLQEKAEGLLFGTAPVHNSLQDDEADCPPLAHFAVLRALLPALERCFRTIEDAPHRVLIAEREERPLHKVRQVDTRSLRTALKRMPVLLALENRRTPATNEAATLDVPRRVHTYDTSPNRHTLALLFRLHALCGNLCIRFAELCRNSDDEPEFLTRAERWRTLTLHYQQRLDRLRRASFFAGVHPARPDAAALMSIARHPAYPSLIASPAVFFNRMSR